MLTHFSPLVKASPKPVLTPTWSGLLQRCTATTECEDCRKKRLGIVQRFATGMQTPSIAPPIVHNVLNSPGQPLDAGTRTFMESSFGHDFSRIRIHNDGQAAKSAQAVNALAYTVGHNVVFGPGQYTPHTHDGQRLIAHELTHTIQQTANGSTSFSASQLVVGDASSPAEQESESVADAIMNSSLRQSAPIPNVAQSGGSTLALQRKVSPELPTIKQRLKKDDVSQSDTHQILGIFKGLSDQDLQDTIRALDLDDHNYIEHFLINISNSDKINELDALRRIKNARVWKIEQTTTDPRTKTKTTVTTEVTGSCSPDQFQKIYQAATTGLGWLDAAISRMDAYIKSPADSKNADVANALNLHFHSKADDVVNHIRSRIDHIRKDMGGLKTLQIECHGSWDKECDDAGAYVPGNNPEMVVFCYAYFNNDAIWQAEAIVHEMAHTQVGGAHITDRAYQSDRLLKMLSTADALTNAESYGLFIQQLGTGKVVTSTAPKDTQEDCPKDWWDLIQKAVALAQRWNRNLQVTLDDMNPGAIKPSSTTAKYLGGATQGNVDKAKKAVDNVANKLTSSIDFECEPDGGGRCDKYATYWYFTGDFHICPSWKNQGSEDARVESLLAGLYGYIGDVDDETRRQNYAKFAKENNAGWESTTLAKVLGSKAWTPDEISVDVTQQVPRLAKYIYSESGTAHERISSDLPVYQSPSSGTTSLPYKVDADFLVEDSNPRPAPFTPPLLSVEFEFSAPAGGFKKSYSDSRPVYTRSSNILQTKLPGPYNFTFNNNGSFHMKFKLDDPDTKVVRVYDDTIQIKVT